MIACHHDKISLIDVDRYRLISCFSLPRPSLFVYYARCMYARLSAVNNKVSTLNIRFRKLEEVGRCLLQSTLYSIRTATSMASG